VRKLRGTLRAARFSGLSPRRAEKIAKICSQNDFTEPPIEFSHGLLEFCNSVYVSFRPKRLGRKRDIDIGGRLCGLPAGEKDWHGLVVPSHHLTLLGFIIANHRNIRLVEPKLARMNCAEDIPEHILVFENDLVGVVYDKWNGFKRTPAKMCVHNLRDIAFGNRDIDLERFLRADQARNNYRSGQTVCVLFSLPEPLVEVGDDIFGQTFSFVSQFAANGYRVHRG
jgi:hypothetical protein